MEARAMLEKALVPLFLFAALPLAGCRSEPKCIQPPPLFEDRDRGTLLDIASQFEKIPGGGSLALDFRDTTQTCFAELSEANTALYLSLQAIDCYLERGAIGQRAAEELAQVVRREWSLKTGTGGLRGGLSPLERDILRRQPSFGDWLVLELRKYGFQ
jgi:hypothetical protein